MKDITPRTDSLVIEGKKDISIPESTAGALSPIVLAAMNSEIDPERLDKMLQIQKDWEANEAEKAFNLALAEFKKNDITLYKDKHVQYTTSKGNTSYWHATLGSALAEINPLLGANGLSLTWETNQAGDGVITVKCILTHALGHSISTSLVGKPDDSGGKNAIQAVGSTVSYLQRYTAFSLLGLASSDMDNDGAGGGGGGGQVDVIDQNQALNIHALVDEVKANVAFFLKAFKVTSIEEIPAGRYAEAVKILEAKRKSAAPK